MLNSGRLLTRSNVRHYRFGVYEADTKTGELRKAGIRLRLPQQPFAVLTMLLERAGDVVTREEMQSRLWQADTFVDFDHSLNAAVNKLRDVLGDSAANPRYIETLAKRGYRFIAPVEAVPEGGAASVVEAAAEPKAEGEYGGLAERRGALLALFSLIQVLYLGVYLGALNGMDRLPEVPLRELIGIVILVTGVLGLALRLYFMAATGFDYKGFSRQFTMLFPLVLALDLTWALSPLLIADRIGVGLAFAAVTGMLFLPFSQRNLIRIAYRG